MNEHEHLTTSDLAGTRGRSSEANESQPRQAGGQSDAPPLAGATNVDVPAPRASGTEPGRAENSSAPLFDQADREGFQDRWDAIQTGFVDQPRNSVEQADALVAEAMTGIARTFAQERQVLEAQWGQGADVSTEDLRVALQRYRSFFERLLAV